MDGGGRLWWGGQPLYWVWSPPPCWAAMGCPLSLPSSPCQPCHTSLPPTKNIHCTLYNLFTYHLWSISSCISTLLGQVQLVIIKIKANSVWLNLSTELSLAIAEILYFHWFVSGVGVSEAPPLLTPPESSPLSSRVNAKALQYFVTL